MAKMEQTIKEYAQKGKKVMASASTKAGEHFQRMGEALIKTIDTRQLKIRLNDKYMALGRLVWEHHRDGKRISFKTKQFEAILEEITRTVEELEGRVNLKEAGRE